MKSAAIALLGAVLTVSLIDLPPHASAKTGEPAAVHSPASPQESLSHFEVASGLKVELVAHEPNVIDPIAIRFDEDGRLWVVEMRDYPTAQPDGPRSRISTLEDRDADGFFETATIFADGLPYVTGLQPWRSGIIVTLAGRVAFMKDTDGDGRADVDETWFSGFAEENTQLRANHPRQALDNHVYIANGLRGGTVVDKRRAGGTPIPISGMDFRFDPLTEDCEAVSGVGQFGLTFDDFGNRFVCTNRNPAIHIVLENSLLKTNPLVAAQIVTRDIAEAGEASHVYPIIRAWTTSNLHAGQFTAACGVEVYRGDALTGDFQGNLFVCEPTGHLVHREVVKPLGVTFGATPADDGKEFLASRDPWFSPVNLETGPDGALYVVDMYRAVIEHPEWMPDELRRRPDLLDGNDHGRIYRVVPSGFRRPESPHLSSISSDQLVDLLAHPNAWWRETAARLLLERGEKSASEKLRQFALCHKSWRACVHALWLLDGLGLLREDVIVALLDDPDPRIVEESIEVSESRVSDSHVLKEKIARLALHDDARVRFEALLVGRPQPSAPVHPTDQWELHAMLLATGKRGAAVLADVLQNSAVLKSNVNDPQQFVSDLAALGAAAAPDHVSPEAMESLPGNEEYGRSGIKRFLRKLIETVLRGTKCWGC